MGHRLDQVSLEGLRIRLPMYSTKVLFDAIVGFHQLMVKFQKLQNKEADILLRDYLRKSSMLETELRNRCVTKEITNMRRRGIKIDGYQKIMMHSKFKKWLRTFIERELKKSFYFKMA